VYGARPWHLVNITNSIFNDNSLHGGDGTLDDEWPSSTPLVYDRCANHQGNNRSNLGERTKNVPFAVIVVCHPLFTMTY
jgi:hypothetical protein